MEHAAAEVTAEMRPSRRREKAGRTRPAAGAREARVASPRRNARWLERGGTDAGVLYERHLVRIYVGAIPN